MAHKTSTRREGTDVGLFHERTQAERATAELKQEGFKDNQIGVLMQDRESQKDLAGSTGTKVSDAATSGAIGGGVAGGILGLLAGVGALAIPGVGPIIAGGALASTLAGAGIGRRLAASWALS
jgi:heat induced stress protein YflT